MNNLVGAQKGEGGCDGTVVVVVAARWREGGDAESGAKMEASCSGRCWGWTSDYEEREDESEADDDLRSAASREKTRAMPPPTSDQSRGRRPLNSDVILVFRLYSVDDKGEGDRGRSRERETTSWQGEVFSWEREKGTEVRRPGAETFSLGNLLAITWFFWSHAPQFATLIFI